MSKQIIIPEFAISIRQPWAWLIVNGFKNIENRTWSTKFRGPVLIHAGLKVDDDFDFGFDIPHPLPEGQYVPWGDSGWPKKPDMFGGIVGIAEVTDCVTASASPWFFGPFGFVLENVRPVPFQPCRGQLGFFRHGLKDFVPG